MHNFGPTDNPWAVVAAEVTFAIPYAILILQQYAKLISIELDAAAPVDDPSPVMVVDSQRSPWSRVTFGLRVPAPASALRLVPFFPSGEGDKIDAGNVANEHLARGKIWLELGSADVRENLRPQSNDTHLWNVHVKDRPENLLHHEVCAGRMNIEEA